ncbi:MAG: hypothetical protein WKG01_42755 [Kofleriaceae bacterium]
MLASLAGCGSGCDGERLKPPEAPRPADSTVTPPGGNPTDPTPSAATGFLDVPAGALDSLHASLVAAERGDQAAGSRWSSSAYLTRPASR